MHNQRRLWLILLLGILLAAMGVPLQAAWPGQAPAVVAAALEADSQEVGDIVPAVDWSPFKYIFVAGTTLRPRNGSTQWTYSGGGCVQSSSASDLLNIHLDIPDGSRIDYLRIYSYDTSASNGQAWVTTYNGAGARNDLVFVQSSGNSGYGYVVSAYVGHVVDTSTRAYVLNWRPNQTGSSMRLCGLRVAYRTVDERVYLPLIRR